MSIRVLKIVLIVTNVLLILCAISGILASYFTLSDEILNKELLILGIYVTAFASWGLLLILTSVCLIGVIFARFVILHFLAALLLLLPLSLTIWLIVEQFLYRMDSLNPFTLTIFFSASLLWTIQILTELILAFCLCCGSGEEEVRQEDEIEKAGLTGGQGEEDDKKAPLPEDGTEEEMEKLVISANEGSALRPHPDDHFRDADEDGDGRSPEPGSEVGQVGGHGGQELALETIPEEKQHLLNSQTSGQCPLATPEDTGIKV